MELCRSFVLSFAWHGQRGLMVNYAAMHKTVLRVNVKKAGRSNDISMNQE